MRIFAADGELPSRSKASAMPSSPTLPVSSAAASSPGGEVGEGLRKFLLRVVQRKPDVELLEDSLCWFEAIRTRVDAGDHDPGARRDAPDQLLDEPRRTDAFEGDSGTKPKLTEYGSRSGRPGRVVSRGGGHQRLVR